MERQVKIEDLLMIIGRLNVEKEFLQQELAETQALLEATKKPMQVQPDKKA